MSFKAIRVAAIVVAAVCHAGAAGASTILNGGAGSGRTTLALFGLGLVGLGFATRRRKIRGQTKSQHRSK